MNKLIIFIITIFTIITSFYQDEYLKNYIELIRNKSCSNEINLTHDETLLNGVDYLINLFNNRNKELQIKNKKIIIKVKKNTIRVIKFTSRPSQPLLIDPIEINSTKIHALKEKYEIKVVKL